MRGDILLSLITMLVLRVLSVRGKKEESKTMTKKNTAKSTYFLCWSVIFISSYYWRAQSCFSFAFPKSHSALVPADLFCTILLPTPGAGSSCWASRCLSDRQMPSPRPQPPWPGARSCCHHQAQRRGGTLPAHCAAQHCPGWDKRKGDTPESGAGPLLCQQWSSLSQRFSSCLISQSLCWHELLQGPRTTTASFFFFFGLFSYN